MDSVVRRRSAPLAALAALRPKQWAKNVLMLPAIIFSEAIRNPTEWVHLGVAFFAFSLLASTGYIFNDWRDIESDRRHPKKRFRPLASGELTERGGWGLMALTFSAALGLAWVVSPQFFVVSLLYFATTLSYSVYFKHIVILDVMFLAACYLWRPVAGAVAIGVAISPWLLLCTAFLALFLGFNKRRGEIMLLEGIGGTRKSLDEYSPAMLSEFQAITTSGTIISYALYTVLGSPTDWLLLTLPFVLFGIFRYIYLMDQKGEGAAPDETLLRDRPILVTCVLYLIVVVAVLGFAPRADRHPALAVEQAAAAP